MKHKYKLLRNKYLPSKIKVVFILESPPANGSYFYNSEGGAGEILFRAFMKVIGYDASQDIIKNKGLKEFQKRGMLLVDSVYTPVNNLPRQIRDEKLKDNYPNLVKDLNSLISKKVPIILVMRNVRMIHENKLVADGFNVMNNGITVPFPLHFHIERFLREIKNIFDRIESCKK